MSLANSRKAVGLCWRQIYLFPWDAQYFSPKVIYYYLLILFCFYLDFPSLLSNFFKVTSSSCLKGKSVLLVTTANNFPEEQIIKNTTRLMGVWVEGCAGNQKEKKYDVILTYIIALHIATLSLFVVVVRMSLLYWILLLTMVFEHLINICLLSTECVLCIHLSIVDLRLI